MFAPGASATPDQRRHLWNIDGIGHQIRIRSGNGINGNGRSGNGINGNGINGNGIR